MRAKKREREKKMKNKNNRLEPMQQQQQQKSQQTPLKYIPIYLVLEPKSWNISLLEHAHVQMWVNERKSFFAVFIFNLIRMICADGTKRRRWLIVFTRWEYRQTQVICGASKNFKYIYVLFFIHYFALHVICGKLDLFCHIHKFYFISFHFCSLQSILLMCLCGSVWCALLC